MNYIFEFSYTIAKNISDKLFWCRLLILDAKKILPAKDQIHFYKKLKSKPLKERQKEQSQHINGNCIFNK